MIDLIMNNVAIQTVMELIAMIAIIAVVWVTVNKLENKLGHDDGKF